MARIKHRISIHINSNNSSTIRIRERLTVNGVELTAIATTFYSQRENIIIINLWGVDTLKTHILYLYIDIYFSEKHFSFRFFFYKNRVKEKNYIKIRNYIPLDISSGNISILKLIIADKVVLVNIKPLSME